MPADGAIVLGLNAYTARNTGTTQYPVYVEVTNVRDETLNMETSLADITNRAANGWRLQVGTLSDASVDTQMVYKAADTEFEFFQTTFLNKSRVLMGFFDDDPALGAADNSVQGLTGGFGVTNFTINRGLEEAMMADVTFQVREDDAGNGPDWTKYVDVPPVDPGP